MEDLLAPENFSEAGAGPLYLQLFRQISDAIHAGQLRPGDCLPSERDMAVMTGLSRVTVRKAVAELAASCQIVQRRGSGTFVAEPGKKLEQALSALTSFSEDMIRRGRSFETRWLTRGLFSPGPEEMMALGIGAGDLVARLERVRSSANSPLAIERASLPERILPDPQAVEVSLYAHLRQRGLAPVRAVQRLTAANLGTVDAGLLQVPLGSAGLKIERISFLESGQVVEFTRSIYRGDSYDFAVELTLSQEERRPE